MTWENITAAFGQVTDCVTQSLNVISGNPVLMTTLCGGLIVLGFRIFRKAKRSVK